MALQIFTTFLYKGLHVHMCASMQATACVWRSEENSWESHHVGARDWIWVFRLGSRCRLLSYSTTHPQSVFLLCKSESVSGRFCMW